MYASSNAFADKVSVDLTRTAKQLTAMRLMTQGERQLLIDLAKEFPALHGELYRKLEADNRLFWKAEREEGERQYSAWRTREIRRKLRNRKAAGVLGPIVTVASIAAACRIGWLLTAGSGGNLFGLIAYCLLAWVGGGMWLSVREPLELPPTSDEIVRRLPSFAPSAATPEPS